MTRPPLTFRRAAVGAAAVLPFVLSPITPAAHAQGTVKLELVPQNATKTLGGYLPVRLELVAAKPMKVTKIPADLTAPLYGQIYFGPKTTAKVTEKAARSGAFGELKGNTILGSLAGTDVVVLLDEPADKEPRFFVDANNNGDLTDDAPVAWTKAPYKGSDGADLARHTGRAFVPLPKSTVDATSGTPVQLSFYRFDKNDAGRAALRSMVLYYRDYARKGTVTLGGKTYSVLLDDMSTTGDFRGIGEKSQVNLLIDVDGNGKFSRTGEQYSAKEPFNIAGTTYEIADIAPSGASLTIRKSNRAVAEILPPPDMSAGKSAVAFTATTTDGKEIAFPTAYKGKIVLLDFWATWCGPCKAELPYLTKAYNELHDKGFEVLGVSLDQADAGAKLAAFTKENAMPWPQVYDGQFWKAKIAQLYGIHAIPAPILIDGTTGKVLASGSEVRGEKLATTIANALASLKTASAK